MSRKSELLIFGAGAIVLLLILTWPTSDNSWLYRLTFRFPAQALTGKSPLSDIEQDILGFKALTRQQNAYPILSVAAHEAGLSWEDANHASAHPPTAFLFAAPIVSLPWGTAAMVWAWLMFGLLVLTFWIYGLPWLVAFGLSPIALLWPPISYSLSQLTIIWLFGMAMGYRYMRKGSYFLSGLGIGLASLTKLIPGLMAVMFLSRKRWSTILGIASIWGISLLILIGLSPNSIAQYADANRLNFIAQILRDDNSSLLAVGFRFGGVFGLILGFVFLALVLRANRRYVFGVADKVPSTELWMLLTYFTVMLLPVSWIYSVTPLFPVIIFLLFKGKRIAFLGSICLIILFFTPAGGPFSVFLLVLVNILIGVGLIFSAFPFRMFPARSVEAISPKLFE